jgi:hypothetical protein
MKEEEKILMTTKKNLSDLSAFARDIFSCRVAKIAKGKIKFNFLSDLHGLSGKYTYIVTSNFIRSGSSKNTP